MSFGVKLKELRLEMNLSQTELAKSLNVCQATISTWEKEIRQPDYDTLKKLCLFFDVSAGHFIGLED